VLGAPIGLCSEEHELISREGPFSGSIIHIHRWVILTSLYGSTFYSCTVKVYSTTCRPEGGPRTGGFGITWRDVVFAHTPPISLTAQVNWANTTSPRYVTPRETAAKERVYLG
jgi:hypothetical protein